MGYNARNDEIRDNVTRMRRDGKRSATHGEQTKIIVGERAGGKV
jgi:hypothetical protein